MILKNSLKQMGRTKSRTIAFLLLLILAVTFLSLGVNLWQACNNNLEEYEKVFTTVGIVNQKENAVVASESWDAAIQEFTYWDQPVYDSILPISLLDFAGANYIIPPEQRPYYGAYSPGIIVGPPEQEEERIRNWVSTIEFMPYEDSVPSKPVRVQVTKVLRGTVKVGADIWVCDHFNHDPGRLEAGKRYITSGTFILNNHTDSNPDAYYELSLYNGTVSHQMDKSGNLMVEEPEAVANWVEVTDQFYETEEGRKWVARVEADESYIRHTIPVVTTSKTKLLMEFHQGVTSIRSGRDITQEEYEKGERVCLISQSMAGRNDLQVGDSINLQLYYADYKRSASLSFFPSGGGILWNNLISAQGEAYPVFEDSDFEVVGLYHSPSKTHNPSGYEMGYNEVIIPAKSIKNSDENNITDFGPMKGYNTSFQIPNGTTKAYLEKFNALGIDNLEISFYDGGYEKLSAGMKNLKSVAFILLLVSGVTTLAILVFFIYMFISKQKKRTAIERSLGMSRKDCMKSMLYGILVVITVGAVVGSLIGFIIAACVIPTSSGAESELYNTAFSNWVNNADMSANLNASASANPLIAILPCLLVILVSFAIALLYIRSNLRTEPLALLSKSEE